MKTFSNIHPKPLLIFSSLAFFVFIACQSPLESDEPNLAGDTTNTTVDSTQFDNQDSIPKVQQDTLKQDTVKQDTIKDVETGESPLPIFGVSQEAEADFNYYYISAIPQEDSPQWKINKLGKTVDISYQYPSFHLLEADSYPEFVLGAYVIWFSLDNIPLFYTQDQGQYFKISEGVDNHYTNEAEVISLSLYQPENMKLVCPSFENYLPPQDFFEEDVSGIQGLEIGVIQNDQFVKLCDYPITTGHAGGAFLDSPIAYKGDLSFFHNLETSYRVIK